MNLRRAKPVLRVQFLGLCMLLGLGALLARLWWVQVARGKAGIGFVEAEFFQYFPDAFGTDAEGTPDTERRLHRLCQMK